MQLVKTFSHPGQNLHFETLKVDMCQDFSKICLDHTPLWKTLPCQRKSTIVTLAQFIDELTVQKNFPIFEVHSFVKKILVLIEKKIVPFC